MKYLLYRSIIAILTLGPMMQVALSGEKKRYLTLSKIGLSASTVLSSTMGVGQLGPKALRIIRLEQLKRLNLFNGKKIPLGKISEVYLREDGTIETIISKDQTVINRLDINKVVINKEKGKEPNQDERVSPGKLEIILPNNNQAGPQEFTEVHKFFQ